MNDEDFEEIWKPVKSVIEYHHMDYDEAVTIGGQFGKLKAEIKGLQEENRKLKFMVEKGLGYEDLSNPDDEINPHFR